MNSVKLLSIFVILILNGCSTNNSQNKIPITSSSEEAIEWYKKGINFENKYEIENAEQAYFKAIEIDTSFALAHLRVAMVKDDYARREIHIEKAMRNIDLLSEGERLLIYARNDFYGKPIEDGLGEYDYAEKLVQLYPDDEQANYLFGYLQVHHGKEAPEEAIPYLNQAISIDPDFIKSYNELAYAYMDLKKYDESEIVIEKYISLVPDKANPYDTYAELLLRQSRYESSIEAYNKVLEINSSFPWAVMGTAANLNFLNRHNEARTFLKKLDKMELSDYEDRHKWRARFTSYIDEGNLDSAIVILKTQNETAKPIQEYTQAYFSYQRVIWLMLEAGYANQALETYREWETYVETEFSNENTIQNVKNQVHFYTAFTHFINNEYDRALDLLDTHYPNPSEQVSVLRARILIRKGNLKEAQNLLAETDMNEPWNRYWHAHTKELLGHSEFADKEYEAILELNTINDIDFSLARASILNRI